MNNTKAAAKTKQEVPRRRFVLNVLPFALVAAFVYGWQIHAEFGTLVMLGAATVLTTVIALQGVSRFSGLAGRIFVVAGALSIIFYLLSDEVTFASYDMFARLGVVLLGFYYEKISPERRLKRWMFLAIGTKIEAVLIAALFSVADKEVLLAQNIWLLVIVLMIVAVPLAARQVKLGYRIVVLSTTVLLVVLSGFTLLQRPDGLTAGILLLAFLWPNILQRIIGVRIFGPPAKRSPSK